MTKGPFLWETGSMMGKSTSLGLPGAAALAEQGQQGPDPALAGR